MTELKQNVENGERKDEEDGKLAEGKMKKEKRKMMGR